MLAIVNFLVFVIGGFIVGLKSAGRTILEPGISSAVGVIIGLLIAGNFSPGNVLASGLVPFLAGILGGWIGDRRQRNESRGRLEGMGVEDSLDELDVDDLRGDPASRALWFLFIHP